MAGWRIDRIPNDVDALLNMGMNISSIIQNINERIDQANDMVSSYETKQIPIPLTYHVFINYHRRFLEYAVELERLHTCINTAPRGQNALG